MKCFNKMVVRNIIVIFLSVGYFNQAIAATYFEENFDSGTISSSPQPVWSWMPAYSSSNTGSFMMRGPNDMYSVSSDRSLTGNYSLRLNFAGRNNWCNQCGSKSVTLSASGCVSVSGAPWATHLYNKSNGFSSWKITSSDSSQVCFSPSPAGNTLFSSSSSISANDTVAIPYQCGVNGTVGGRVDKRSDCNRAINYLNGVSSSHFGYGDTISRRFYIYIPSATVLPSSTFKLGYAHWRRGSSRYATTVKLEVSRGATFDLTTPKQRVASGTKIKKDQWVYIEEVWTRETSDSANDGSYKLYTNTVGQFTNTPFVSHDNITIGSIVNMSINGNFQHNNDVKGYVYFDGILISDKFVGPLGVKIPKSVTGETAVGSR